VDATLRYRLEADPAALATLATRRGIFAVWHNRLALSLRVYARFVCRGDRARRLAAIVSASRDGGMLARVLELFRVQPVRGSSSRRGAQAVLELISWAARGYDLAITPDGPRGPRYVVQEGVIHVASVSGLPVIPVSYDLSLRHEAKSWDRFQIPLPGSRCVVRFGEPLRVPPEVSDAERARLREELQRRLRALTDRGGTRSVPPVS
jgi:lysophospholipid acyltransferase (LPLAT)-like uncharacterized protein